jgi:hypothetical protein
MGVREMRRGKLRDCYAVALARGGKRWLAREHRGDCDDGIDAFQKSRADQQCGGFLGRKLTFACA